MQPENIPRASPLAGLIYGHDVRIVNDPAMLERADRASQGASSRLGVLAGSGVLRYGELAIDTRTRIVTYGPMPVALRRREYALLSFLARDPERVWTRHELLRDVWGFRSEGSTRTVDMHASRVRRVLASAGASGWVVSVWGVGYRLAP
jgi:DNA-binding response OmpR family regulator